MSYCERNSFQIFYIFSFGEISLVMDNFFGEIMMKVFYLQIDGCGY